MAISIDVDLLEECKWINKLVDLKILSDLFMKSAIFPIKNIFYGIFKIRVYTRCIGICQRKSYLRHRI